MSEGLKNEELLCQVLASMASPDDIRALLDDLFTSREIRESASRLNVARLLNDGFSYLEIENETGVSPTTIARVSKCLNEGAGGYKKALQHMK